MSWGLRITILYLAFVALILTLVFMASAHKVDLVSKDYYEQEIKYQTKIDAIKNYNMLEKEISIVEKKDIVEVVIPEAGDISGSIHFFRPSNSELDYIQQIIPAKSSDQNDSQMTIQQIEKKNLEKGMYTIQISFNTGGKEYYKEEVIFIK